MDAGLAIDLPHARVASRAGWIHSRRFDLSFFILSPLLGFAIAASLPLHAADTMLLLSLNYLIGVPHYIASFGFFGGVENRVYARERYVAFLVVPVLIGLAVTALYATRRQHWVHAVLFVWNIWHVASQSAGLMSLYRKLNGGRFEERTWCHRMIVFANAAMAFWHLEHFPPLWNLLVAVDERLPAVLRLMFAVAAVGYAVGYAASVRRRGFGLSGVEVAALSTALLLFTPYLWLTDSNLATLTMLSGHFIQYLAIVWLLDSRKYAAAPSTDRGERLLAAFGRSWRGVAAYMLLVALLFASFEQGARQWHLYAIFMIAFNTLALSHFYLDGMIWAFKNPFIRRTVAPYLTLDANRLR
jgi:hypothetical protein